MTTTRIVQDQVTVTIHSNVDKVKQEMRAWILSKAALAGGEVIRNHAKINIRKTFSSKSRGGAGLAGSMNVYLVESTDTAAYVEVGPTKVYGRIQELGGIIKPVVAKALSWINDAGVRVFAKIVHIPARPYLRPAVDENQLEIRDAVGYQIVKGVEIATRDIE